MFTELSHTPQNAISSSTTRLRRTLASLREVLPKMYIAITGWHHQKIDHSSKSKIPVPPEKNSATTGCSPNPREPSPKSDTSVASDSCSRSTHGTLTERSVLNGVYRSRTAVKKGGKRVKRSILDFLPNWRLTPFKNGHGATI